MAEAVLQGPCRYRDGKKWKPRWCSIRKLSPVADRLHLYLYKDNVDCCKQINEKNIIPLEDFFGIQSGFQLDKESHVMAIVCKKMVVVLAFSHRMTQIDWEIKIREQLGEERQFAVELLRCPHHSNLSHGQMQLFLHTLCLCLTTGIPPRLLASWSVPNLRRFGMTPGKFMFEGGSSCGKGEGLYVFSTDQGEEITHLLNLISKGKIPNSRPGSANRGSLSSAFTSLSPHLSLAGAIVVEPSEVKQPIYTDISETYSELPPYVIGNECDDNVFEDDPAKAGTLTSIENYGNVDQALRPRPPSYHSQHSSDDSSSLTFDPQTGNLRRCNKRHSLDDIHVSVNSSTGEACMVATACKVVKTNLTQDPFGLLGAPLNTGLAPSNNKSDRNTLPRQHKHRNRNSGIDSSNGKTNRNLKKRHSTDMLTDSGSVAEVNKWAARTSQLTIISSSSSSGSKDSMPSSGCSDENLDPRVVAYTHIHNIYGSSRRSESPVRQVLTHKNTASESLCSAVEGMAVDPSIHPKKPLQYVDLQRFDGEVEKTTSVQPCLYIGQSSIPATVNYADIVCVEKDTPPPSYDDHSSSVSGYEAHSNYETYNLIRQSWTGSCASSLSTQAADRSRSSSVSGPSRSGMTPGSSPTSSERGRSASICGSLMPSTQPPVESQQVDAPPLPARPSRNGDDNQLLKKVPPPFGSLTAPTYPGAGMVNQPAKSMNLLAKVPPPGGPEPKHSYSHSAPDPFVYGTNESDYMPMKPASTNVGSTRSDSVFCMVELPTRRSDSYASSAQFMLQASQSSLSSNPSSTDYSSYMDMSTTVYTGRMLGRSMSLKEDRRSLPRQLIHSKSFDDELEGRDSETLSAISQESNMADYLPMRPVAGDSEDSAPRKPSVPFENLISLNTIPNRPSNKSASLPPPLPPSRPQGKGSDSSSSTPGKQGFLSRLIRRNSTKERKSSKSHSDEQTQERSYVNQTVNNKVDVVSTGVNAVTDTGSPGLYHRKGSADLLTITEEDHHSPPSLLYRSNTVPSNMCHKPRTGSGKSPKADIYTAASKPPPVPPRRDSVGGSLHPTGCDDVYFQIGSTTSLTSQESFYPEKPEEIILDRTGEQASLKAKLEVCVPPPAPVRSVERRASYTKDMHKSESGSDLNINAKTNSSVALPVSANDVTADSGLPIENITEPNRRASVHVTKSVAERVCPTCFVDGTLPPVSPRTLPSLLEETVPPPVPKRPDRPLSTLKQNPIYADMSRKTRMATPEKVILKFEPESDGLSTGPSVSSTAGGPESVSVDNMSAQKQDHLRYSVGERPTYLERVQSLHVEKGQCLTCGVAKGNAESDANTGENLSMYSADNQSASVQALQRSAANSLQSVHEGNVQKLTPYSSRHSSGHTPETEGDECKSCIINTCPRAQTDTTVSSSIKSSITSPAAGQLGFCRRRRPNLTLPGSVSPAPDEPVWVLQKPGSNKSPTSKGTQSPGNKTNQSPSNKSNQFLSKDPHKRESQYSQTTSTTNSSTASNRSSDVERLQTSDKQKNSPASTTLRPRFGREYQQLDRKKLAEMLESPKTPQSPKVFTFEDISIGPSVPSCQTSLHSSVTNSPKSPGISTKHVENPYVNISLPLDRNDVSASIGETPPASPFSAASCTSESSSPLLHYAEIDLTHSSRKKKSTRMTRRSTSDTEYAKIDMLATTAAAAVGKEHAQLREDTLRWKDEKSAGKEDSGKETPKSKDRKGSTQSVSVKRASSLSLSSRDRKHSTPS